MPTYCSKGTTYNCMYFCNYKTDINLILTLNFHHLVGLQYVIVWINEQLSEQMDGFSYSYFIIERDIVDHYKSLLAALHSFQYLSSRSLGVYFSVLRATDKH